MSLAEPNCWKRKCKHYQGVSWLDGKEETSEAHICDAFPRGIPEEIAYGDNEHTEPYKGDNGVKYERDVV